MATQLTDMKFTKAEAKAQAEEYSKPSPDNEPSYPWGLEIRLEDESLSKLGLTDLPEVGEEFRLVVVAQVKSASESKMASGRTDRCVCLQITQLGVESETGDADDKPAPAATKQTKQPSKGGVLGRS